jgi:hypothetical protein
LAADGSFGFDCMGGDWFSYNSTLEVLVILSSLVPSLTRFCLASAVCLAAASAFAQVAAPIPTNMEGPISAIESDGGTGATMTVMGATIHVPASAHIHTPSATLTIAQLLDVTTPLPGRTQGGFLGATTISNGTVDPATGIVTADDVFVEPAENVIVGVVTQNDTEFRVNNVPVVFLTDPRIPAGPPMNDLGFEINLADVPVGIPASIEGYYSNDGSGLIQTFHLECTGVRSKDPSLQVSMLRIRGDAATRSLEVRGGVSGLPAAGAVTIQIRAGNRVLGTAAAFRSDPAFPSTAHYRCRGVIPAPFPANITARVTAAGFPTAPRIRTANSAAQPAAQ